MKHSYLVNSKKREIYLTDIFEAYAKSNETSTEMLLNLQNHRQFRTKIKSQKNSCLKTSFYINKSLF